MRTKTQRRQHARQRSFERHGIALTKDLRREVIALIRGGQSLRKRKLTDSRTAHLVEVRGVQIPVVYSKRTKDIVTVLPKDCWQLGEEEDGQQ